jgi:hypothetical protein
MIRIEMFDASNGDRMTGFDPTVKGLKTALESALEWRVKGNVPATIRVKGVVTAGAAPKLCYGDLETVGVLKREVHATPFGEDDFFRTFYWTNVNPLVSIKNEYGQTLNYGDEPEVWEE